jgi:RsiW-degrading membrane proteinase PrsW (M82 family)
MPVSVRCPACGTGHKAPDRATGKTLACLNCRAPIIIPSSEPIDPAAILLQDDDVEPPPSNRSLLTEEPPPVSKPVAEKPRKQPQAVNPASLPPLSSNDPPLWRRHLHWLLVLALIPLVVSLLTQARQVSIEERLAKSIEEAPPAERDRIFRQLEHAESLDDLISALPGQRLPGAFLGRSSKAHLIMAALTTLFYMAFFMFLASDGSANPRHILLVGLFTATVGVGFLLLVQLLASLTEGRVLVGFNIVAILFVVLKFIAFSYGAAMNPENGFFISFVGFTLGVGLCEELVKAIPLFWHRSTAAGSAWRGMLIWGLASGAGFGIAEGIMYSGRYYNGVTGSGIYVVRFLSCVALHAIWSGSVAILLYHRRDLFEGLEHWRDWIAPTIVVIAIPALLHGLYDTCLKKELNGAALLVAVASFGYLAYLLSRLQTGDDVAANEELLREYQTRKRAMA